MQLLHKGKAAIVGFEDFDLPESVEVIGCNATSTEHLDKYREKGIKVLDLKGETEFLSTVTSTAEHTIGLIIALARNYKTALHSPYKDRDFYKGHTLRGKTLGIIGLGRVGKQMTLYAHTLLMRVAYAERGDYVKGISESAPRYVDLLQRSDFVTLHIPLEGNEGFFTLEMFHQMKKTAYLINTSRSGIIKDGELLWALENNLIAGAAIDFTDDEELLEYEKENDNLILTNHLGGNTEEDRKRTEDFIISKIDKYFE